MLTVWATLGPEAIRSTAARLLATNNRSQNRVLRVRCLNLFLRKLVLSKISNISGRKPLQIGISLWLVLSFSPALQPGDNLESIGKRNRLNGFLQLNHRCLSP